MSGYEHVATKEELERLGDPRDLRVVLAALYHDAGVPLNVRINALTSLASFPSPEGKALLEKVIASRETSDIVRRPALLAYGAGFHDEAVPLVKRYLDHTDLHTRNAAARSLGRIPSPAAREALRTRLPQEPEPLVRSTIQAALVR